MSRRHAPAGPSRPLRRRVLGSGMVDKYSWLQGRWPRQDQAAKRPTPYDDDYRPKPLRDAMAAAFSAAPNR